MHGDNNSRGCSSRCPYNNSPSNDKHYYANKIYLNHDFLDFHLEKTKYGGIILSYAQFDNFLICFFGRPWRIQMTIIIEENI